MSSINFTEQELHEIIKQQLTGPNKDLLVQAVFGICQNASWKKEKIIKAALGIINESEHRLHEVYLVKTRVVSTYDIDEAQSKEKGFINNKGEFTCKLVKFNPWECHMYHVEYKYIDSAGKVYKNEYDVKASDLESAEEFPEDF